jgi:uncharacterized protein
LLYIYLYNLNYILHFMKPSTMPLFILFFVGLYLLGSFYVFIRGLQAFPSNTLFTICYSLIFTLLASGYFISRAVEHTDLYLLHKVSYWLGAVWLATLLYFFLAVLLIDAIRLLNLGFHFLPGKESMAYLQLKNITLWATLSVVFLLLTYGFWNASHPQTKQVNLVIKKQAGGIKNLNIVMVSDIHLGSLFGKDKITDLTHRINILHPDIVLLVGDILDEAQKPIFRNHIGEPLKDIKAPMGVYAVTGNHEYIGGVDKAVEYLRSLNITLLRDTTILVNNSFYLAGREDKDLGRFQNKTRKPLKNIVQHVDHQLPLILLDHQPAKLEQAVENGVDLQLSGHTHNGQFWPFNLITQRVYEVSWGYKRKGNTHVYVSSGYGTWGPPIRIASTPEIVSIGVEFL